MPKKHARPTDDSLPLPPDLAELMWPELPALTEAIAHEIRTTIPEYARTEQRYGQVIRLATEELLNAFVARVADPHATYRDRDHLCRMLGQLEFHEGRTLDTLQAAFRIGLQKALHRAIEVGSTLEDVPVELWAALPTRAVAYLDEIARIAVEGYNEAQAQAATGLEEQRLELLHAVVREPPVSQEEIRERAARTGWHLPEEVTMVAISSGAPVQRTMLNRHLLVDFETMEPFLLIPGAMTGRKQAMLEAILAGATGCVGLTVPLRAAARSLRWARRAIELAAAGLIPAGKPFIRCEEHVMEIWLLSDPDLIGQLERQHLAPLNAVAPQGWKRDKMAETLAVWLATGGSMARTADQLGVHQGTVRYRVKRLKDAFGFSLRDPEERFAIEAVLRARELLRRDDGDAV